MLIIERIEKEVSRAVCDIPSAIYNREHSEIREEAFNLTDADYKDSKMYEAMNKGSFAFMVGAKYNAICYIENEEIFFSRFDDGSLHTIIKHKKGKNIFLQGIKKIYASSVDFAADLIGRLEEEVEANEYLWDVKMAKCNFELRSI